MGAIRLRDEYTGELSIKRWVRVKLYHRRKRLVRKWALNTDFKKQSISGTWEVEFFNLVPEDDRWHHVTATVMAYVKKDKKVVRPDSDVTQYVDGVKIAQVQMTRGNNIEIGRPKKGKK